VDSMAAFLVCAEAKDKAKHWTSTPDGFQYLCAKVTLRFKLQNLQIKYITTGLVIMDHLSCILHRKEWQTTLVY